MDNLEKGSWIINTIKHTTGVRTDTVELNDLEVTERAGKSGILLGKLLVDKQEIITGKKLSVFARTANISPDAVKTYAEILKNFGQVDFKLDKFGNVSELEIYCLTTEDAIKTVSDIFEYYEPDEIERGNLESLKTTFEFPASREELTQALTSRKGISEENVNEILALESAFSLIKKERIENSDIYYNEYAFAGDGSKIAKAIASLPESQRNDVNFVMEQVKQSQGFLADNLTDKINPNIISMMEGVGLLDGITVNSDFGKAVFYTTPQLIGPGIGSWKISTDVVTLDGETYFVTGDTDANEDNIDVQCDILLVPCGGKYTFDVKEAAEFTQKIKPKKVIPTHYTDVIGESEVGDRFKRATMELSQDIEIEVML